MVDIANTVLVMNGIFGEKKLVAHRLDKETSGLILIAKNKKLKLILKACLKKLVQKEYLALAHGKIEENFIVDKAII